MFQHRFLPTVFLYRVAPHWSGENGTNSIAVEMRHLQKSTSFEFLEIALG